VDIGGWEYGVIVDVIFDMIIKEGMERNEE
jgi:hypothetical protein